MRRHPIWWVENIDVHIGRNWGGGQALNEACHIGFVASFLLTKHMGIEYDLHKILHSLFIASITLVSALMLARADSAKQVQYQLASGFW